jgi:hypothetical protein
LEWLSIDAASLAVGLVVHAIAGHAQILLLELLLDLAGSTVLSGAFFFRFVLKVSLEYHEVAGAIFGDLSSSIASLLGELFLLLLLILVLLHKVVLEGIDHVADDTLRLGGAAQLDLELLLLLLLKFHLLLVELVDGRRENLCVVVWRVEGNRGVLFYPKVLRGLEIVAED